MLGQAIDPQFKKKIPRLVALILQRQAKRRDSPFYGGRCVLNVHPSHPIYEALHTYTWATFTYVRFAGLRFVMTPKSGMTRSDHKRLNCTQGFIEPITNYHRGLVQPQTSSSLQ
ncbi:hypothetical protein A0H81_00266 [Grifola frondosa]|uniref:Uncharacterized protein n=1 Tax=Grifola frondosa TaxID=5627 RepID=A0A1C7MT70_GRIFR|nr:hypothetical protein A0H81_00266 [Grifola frondosa]